MTILTPSTNYKFRDSKTTFRFDNLLERLPELRKAILDYYNKRT